MAELWTCPRCGHRFRWRNQWHSCVRVDVQEHLHGKPERVVELYRAYEAEVLGLGDDVELDVVKGRIAFRARIRFAGCTVQQRGLRCAVLLPKVQPHTRFVKIETYLASQHGHHFRIDRLDDLDDDVRGWLRQAYVLGSH